MATTKIKAIKNTLKKAIDYIINPEKTEDSTLVSTYGCSVEFADLEMQATAVKGSGQGNRIAYHFLQSFAVDDDITPEKAHEIGKEFADKYLKGKYEYVIATHVDKDHVHNHIIFNAVNFEDYKKYRYSGEYERDKIRAISDKLCRENGLSVIESQSGRRGWKRGDKQKSHKATMMDIIDKVIPKVTSFEEFLTVMELEHHYDIQHRGQMVSLKPEDGDKYIRLKASTLGENYTEEAIRKRIEHPELFPKPRISKPEKSKESKKLISKKNKKKINLIVDISNNIKAQESKGYEIVLQRSNTENLIRTMNFLIDRKITTPDKFFAYTEPIKQEYEKLRTDKKSLDDKIRGLTEKIKYAKLYNQYKPLYLAYERTPDREEFHAKYAKEISLYRASLIYFERAEIAHPEKIILKDLFQEMKELKSQAQTLNINFKNMQNKIYELNVIQKNIETTLDIRFSEMEKNDKSVEAGATENDKISERQTDEKSK